MILIYFNICIEFCSIEGIHTRLGVVSSWFLKKGEIIWDNLRKEVVACIVFGVSGVLDNAAVVFECCNRFVKDT